ncbi:MAG: hypothetical protein ACYSWU_26775 [Planctomycetota bacterium]|jgi:hypothetical protein
MSTNATDRDATATFDREATEKAREKAIADLRAYCEREGLDVWEPSAAERQQFERNRERLDAEVEDYLRCQTSLTLLLDRLSGPARDIRKLQAVFNDLSVLSNGSLFVALPYSEYLKTHHWQRCRKRALKIAGWRCQVCNASDCELHVHHRTYERLGKEWETDVVCLCESCHSLFHGKAEEDAA